MVVTVWGAMGVPSLMPEMLVAPVAADGRTKVRFPPTSWGVVGLAVGTGLAVRVTGRYDTVPSADVVGSIPVISVCRGDCIPWSAAIGRTLETLETGFIALIGGRNWVVIVTTCFTGDETAVTTGAGFTRCWSELVDMSTYCFGAIFRLESDLLTTVGAVARLAGRGDSTFPELRLTVKGATAPVVMGVAWAGDTTRLPVDSCSTWLSWTGWDSAAGLEVKRIFCGPPSEVLGTFTKTKSAKKLLHY